MADADRRPFARLHGDRLDPAQRVLQAKERLKLQHDLVREERIRRRRPDIQEKGTVGFTRALSPAPTDTNPDTTRAEVVAIRGVGDVQVVRRRGDHDIHRLGLHRAHSFKTIPKVKVELGACGVVVTILLMSRAASFPERRTFCIAKMQEPRSSAPAQPLMRRIPISAPSASSSPSRPDLPRIPLSRGTSPS